ncbi:virulence factor TspB C-terminal domain-related protein [Acinetobacter baumannii]|nr:virulence factor TspB C-terminal domain-related protein [Acinetobacter baumannii]
MRKLLKQINVIILSFVLIFAPTYVFATSVSAEGWSVTKRLVQGATTFYDGTKNIVLNGKNYAATGAAAITPTAAQVSKMIVRTGAVLAVDLAIKSLIGAVSYVMDPANNRVKYYVKPDAQDPNAPDVKYYLVVSSAPDFPDLLGKKITLTDNSLCASLSLKTNNASSTFTTSTLVRDPGNGKYYCKAVMESGSIRYVISFDMLSNPNYDPNSTPREEEKYLPYDAVASQIMSDAVADKAEGKAYVSSVADTALEDEQRQIVPATDVINQLDNSQAIPTSNTAQGAATPKPVEGTPDPTQPQPTPYDITINFPIFCSWAPSVCQAAQVAINFPAKVDKWIEGLFYNTKGLPEYDNKTDLFIHEQPEIKHVSINWGSVCPAPVTVPLSFMGISREITVVNYQYICDYAWIIKASVNMVASISAVYIVAGRKE